MILGLTMLPWWFFNACINLVSSIVPLQESSEWCLQDVNLAVWFLALELFHVLFPYALPRGN